jgi:hypothetical protein
LTINAYFIPSQHAICKIVFQNKLDKGTFHLVIGSGFQIETTGIFSLKTLVRTWDSLIIADEDATINT